MNISNTFQKKILALLVLIISLVSANATCQDKTSNVKDSHAKVDNNKKKKKKI